jgi:hypothetical protein
VPCNAQRQLPDHSAVAIASPRNAATESGTNNGRAATTATIMTSAAGNSLRARRVQKPATSIRPEATSSS